MEGLALLVSPFFYLYCMHRHALLLVIGLSFIGATQAQVMGYKSKAWLNDPGNPGGLNTLDEFPQGQGLDTSWKVIQSGSNSTPQWTSTQTLPFTFELDGNPYTQYIVSTSGVLTFNIGASTVPDGNNTYLPHSSIPDQSICIWGMEGKGSNDIIVSQTFGNAPNRQHWVFFNSYNVPGGSANCWTYWSIVLEETTNKIYFVDQRHLNCDPGFTLGVQLDARTAYEVDATGEIFQHSENNASDIDNQYYEMEYDTLTVFNYDMAVVAVDLDTILAPGNEPFTISGNMKNYGSVKVTDLDVLYNLNGGLAETHSMDSLDLDYTEHMDFTHSVQWTPPSQGAFVLRIWAQNINGNADFNHTNDTLIHSLVFGVVGIGDGQVIESGQVYPNPVSSKALLMLDMREPLPFQLRLRNTLGQVVRDFGKLQAQQGTNQVVFDVSGLASGLYLLELTSSKAQELIKIQVGH
jgi:hypothetical protein